MARKNIGLSKSMIYDLDKTYAKAKPNIEKGGFEV